MSPTLAPGRVDRDIIAEQLPEARARTFLLVAPLTDDELRMQHDPLMSPILWDLGHIAHFEELWLTRNLDGPIEFVEMPGLYNPFEHPRSTRGGARASRPGARRARSWTRSAAACWLGWSRWSSTPPIRCCATASSTRWCCSTSTSTTRPCCRRCSSSRARPTRRSRGSSCAGARPAGLMPPSAGEMVRFPGGAGHRSAPTTGRPPTTTSVRAHAVEVAPFWIDAHPVTNRRLPGLHRAPAGTRRRSTGRRRAGAGGPEVGAGARPSTGPRRDGVWTHAHHGPARSGGPDVIRSVTCAGTRRRRSRASRASGCRPRSSGRRRRTWDPGHRGQPRLPVGRCAARPHARQRRSARASAPRRSAATRANVSPIGCYGMIGDVWEWTSSDFGPWPGFESFPYPEYSEVFFGTEYKVLRGGSWATRPGAIRNTFRNWDYPIRRQIFSGFRCARDD